MDIKNNLIAMNNVYQWKNGMDLLGRIHICNLLSMRLFEKNNTLLK